MAVLRALLASGITVAVGLGMSHSAPGGRVTTFTAHGERSSVTHPLGYTVHSETFRSAALPLNAGEVAFTNAVKTKLVFPQVAGPYAVTKFHAEIVDAENRSVPLSEVYLHHWLVFNAPTSNDGVCGGFLGYEFGVGAESRGTPVSYPDGYGYFTDGSQNWTTNIHIFRTQGLKPRANHSQTVKECIECLYSPEGGKGGGCTEQWSGTFECCFDGSHCPTDGSIPGKKDYYFLYTVEYTLEVSAVRPIHVYVLDASDCNVDFNIDANEAQPLLKTEHSWTSEVEGSMVLGVGHLHNAGVNITLLRNGEEVCTTVPVYGTEVGRPGNEKGYLVAAPPCIREGDIGATLRVSVGDTFTLRSYYWVGYADPTGSALPGGFHGGVMSLFYLGMDVESMRDARGRRPEARKVLWRSAPLGALLV